MKNHKSGRQKAHGKVSGMQKGNGMPAAVIAAVALLCIVVAVCVTVGRSKKKDEESAAADGQNIVQSRMADNSGETEAQAEDAAFLSDAGDENEGQSSSANTASGGKNQNSGAKGSQKAGEKSAVGHSGAAAEGNNIEASEEGDGNTESVYGTGEADGEKTEENKKDREISLPYKIPGSDLVLLRLAGYDGTYLEDGTDSDISNVAAILLQNTGTADVEYTSVSIGYDGGTLEFEASAIPRGASVIVQEKNKAGYKDQTYTSCKGTSALSESFEMSEDKVSVEDNEDGSLRITNQSGKDIDCVRIMYKLYMEEEDTYVGGITYMSKVDDLKADESRTITPSHYDAGHSRVMMVKIYDGE
ncbi:MAG: hypothetical protein Q4C58_11015 [Eubacteriales bacterium]|nr:hypothetical protein [Eubacteriales bacterium]